MLVTCTAPVDFVGRTPRLDLSDPADERRSQEGRRRREVREQLDRELQK